MKKVIYFIICLTILSIGAFYRENIATFIVETLIYRRGEPILTTNEYTKRHSFQYLNITEDFFVKDKQSILNVFYTFVDSGMEEFYFYCDRSYASCVEDIERISSDAEFLSVLNNFVNPYNSYDKIFVSTNGFGKIKLQIEKLYSKDDTELVDNYINDFIKNNINDEMKIEEQIRLFHNEIISKTKYDQQYAIAIKNTPGLVNMLESHKASGVIKNNIALCSGYTDIMSIYLTKLKVPNFKIATSEHIWNAVYINNKWLHLDLTWDDPVTSNGQDVILEEFFLINTNDLLSKKTGQHEFDKNIYIETAS